MRPPPPRVWQQSKTNAIVPKKSRSGPTAVQPAKSKSRHQKRGQWKETDMHLALAAVQAKSMSIRQAREFYGIPSSSIQDWKNKKTTSKKIGHQTYLTEIEELALVK